MFSLKHQNNDEVLFVYKYIVSKDFNLHVNHKMLIVDPFYLCFSTWYINFN